MYLPLPPEGLLSFLGAAMVLTGAEIVIRCLQEEKVEYVFGYPGGAVPVSYTHLTLPTICSV